MTTLRLRLGTLEQSQLQSFLEDTMTHQLNSHMFWPQFQVSGASLNSIALKLDLIRYMELKHKSDYAILSHPLELT